MVCTIVCTMHLRRGVAVDAHHARGRPVHARAVGRRVVAVRQLGLRARCGRLRARGGRERGERAAVAVGAVHVRAAEQPGGGAGKCGVTRGGPSSPLLRMGTGSAASRGDYCVKALGRAQVRIW